MREVGVERWMTAGRTTVRLVYRVADAEPQGTGYCWERNDWKVSRESYATRESACVALAQNRVEFE